MEIWDAPGDPQAYEVTRKQLCERPGGAGRAATCENPGKQNVLHTKVDVTKMVVFRVPPAVANLKNSKRVGTQPTPQERGVIALANGCANVA